MTDRELLENAAKAAGESHLVPYKAEWLDSPDAWKPLTDDGDALRLAVKLKISIEHPNPYDLGGGFITASVRRAYYRHVLKEDLFFNETFDGDPCAATRRAIVRAAAEIGKSLENAND